MKRDLRHKDKFKARCYKIMDINKINLQSNFGDFDLGYVNFFFMFIPFLAIVGLSAAGQKKHVGGGLIMGSLYLGFSGSVIFGTYWVFVPVLIAIGFILMIVKGGIVDL